MLWDKSSYFGTSHWSVRIAQLALLLAILLWQSRHTFQVLNPMYGWPMPFNNIWYSELDEWRLSILLIDVLVWSVLAASLGSVLQRLQKPRFGVMQMFVIPGVFAILVGLTMFEFYILRNPNNTSIFPRYSNFKVGRYDFWLDIGLFTDPPNAWLIARIPIMLSIGCALYLAAETIISTVWRKGSGLSLDCNDASDIRTPIFARVIIWLLVTSLVFYAILTLSPPSFH